MRDLDDFLTPQDPPEKAPCGCDVDLCFPATHKGRRYCMGCDNDLPVVEPDE